MQAVRAGDDHAFERLYHRYHRRISAYIFGMVHDHGRAEDLTQEVFVNALRRMRATDRPIVFKPWVYEIAKNACIDQFRRTSRAEEVSIDAEDGAGLAPSDQGKLHARGQTPDAAVESKQQLADLQGAFGGLSEAHHQILVMRELEGLSYREIGERLGMSRPSVESTLFRARRRLTEEYEELRTGERCLRIQGIIEGASAGSLGIRDQRRVGSHITHCQPCRKHAVMAGLDAGAIARRPVRARIAAFLPLPGFLKRLVGGSGDASDVVAGHTLAATAAQHGDAMAGWMKAGAVAAAVALAGAGTAGISHVTSADGAKPSGDTAGKAADAVRGGGASGAFERSAAAASAAGAGAAGTGSSAGGGSSSSHVTKARGGTSHSSSAGIGSTSGPAGAADGSGSGAGKGFSGDSSGSGGSSADKGSSGSGSKETASSSATPSKGSSSGSGSTSTTTTATDPVTSTVTETTTAVTGGGSSQPLVDPNLGALTGGGSSEPPASTGEVVSGTTDAVGGAVGGQVGGVVQGAGEAVGNTVDQTLGAVGSILGGGKKQ
ncbi:sigma-70 family RNA polymerase sigma factor [Baekduia sp. Peel2402]|uniref:sigma-70 family RNA polymerase sigma factor n=1 Tax=Baekduia sp. Peel2402 TaxID=3458296 RepID=UPI00403E5DFA